MLDRILGVFRLDVNTFEAIEHDDAATAQAVLVVAIVAVLTGLGSGFGAQISGGNFFNSFISTLVWAYIGWFLWSAVSFFVGTALFDGQSSIPEMLRVLGFAQIPLVLGIIPCVGWFVGGIWALIAGFIAIRQGLDIDNLKAFLTAVIGFFIVALGNLVISAFFGGITSIFG